MEYLAISMDLAWFTVAAVSVILLRVREFHRHRKGGGLRRALSLLLALLVLFPSLSIRDDLIGLAFLSQRTSQRNQPAIESEAGSDFHLGIHLQALDDFLVTSLHDLPTSIRFAAWVPSATLLLTEYSPLVKPVATLHHLSDSLACSTLAPPPEFRSWVRRPIEVQESAS